MLNVLLLFRQHCFECFSHFCNESLSPKEIASIGTGESAQALGGVALKYIYFDRRRCRNNLVLFTWNFVLQGHNHLKCRLVARPSRVYILRSTPAKRHSFHPVDAPNPERIYRAVIHLCNTQFIFHVPGTACVRGSNKEHCLSRADSLPYGIFPIRSAGLAVFP